MAVALDELVARLRLDTSGFQQGMGQVRSTMSSVGSKMQSAGSTLTRSVTLPLVGVAAAGVKLAADFDKTMRQVSIATGGPSKSLEALAKQMGADTSFSAGEAADAMLELAKGGMTAAQIEGGGLAATMKLASAGGVDLASSATYVSNAMAAFGLSAKDADSVTVALAGAANASSASVESLGQGLSQVASAATNSGLSLQETVGVLSAFDAQGIKGSDAGTSLKTMLTRLVPATDKAKAKMNELGLDFTKADGSFVSIANVAEQLQQKLGPMGDAQRTAAMQTLFGADAARAASALMNMGAEGVNKYTKAARDSATTNKLANAAMKGTSGAMERAKGSVENAALALGQTLAPHVEKIAGHIERLANKFAALSPATQGMIVKFAAIAAAVGPLLIALGAVARGISGIAAAGSLMGKGVGGIASGAAKARTGLTNLVAGMRSSQAASSAFTGKMGTIGGAISRTASAFGRGVAAAARWAAGMVASAARGVAAMVKAGARIAATWLMMAARAMASAARMAAAWLISLGPIGIIIAAVVGAVALIIANWDKVKRALIATWNAIKSAARAVWNGLKAVVTAVVGAIVAAVRGYMRIWLAVMKGAWNAIKSAATTVWNAIKSVITGVVNGIKSVVTSVVNGIKAVWTRTWQAIKSAASSVWSGIKSVVSNAINGVKTVVSNGINGAKQVMSNAWNAIKSAVSTAWSAIKGAVSTGISGVMNVVTSLPGKITGALSGAGQWLVDTGKDVVNGLINGLQSMAGSIVDTLVGLLPGPLQKFADTLGISSPSRVFAKFGRWVGAGFIRGLKGSQSDVERAMSSLASKVSEVWDAKYKSDERAERAARRTMRALRDEMRDVEQLAERREDLNKRLAAAEDRLREAIKRRADFAKSVAQTALGTGSVVAASEVEEGEALTSRTIVGSLRDRLAALQRFADQLKVLRRRGLNAATYRELLEAGPESAGATAAALAAGGDDAVKQVNALQGAMAREANALGARGASELYDAGVKSARGFVNGLARQDRQLDRAANRLASRLARAVRRELGIRSPSRVFEQMGRQVGEGMARGIDASTARVQTSMRRLTAVPGAQTPYGQGMHAAVEPTRSGPTITVNARTDANPYEIAREIGWQMRGVA